MSKRFASPREEALEIALQTRKKILDGNTDASSVLRACLVVAKNLNKDNEQGWMMSELSGYDESGPNYRIVMCQYTKDGAWQEGFHSLRVSFAVHVLLAKVALKQDMDIRDSLEGEVKVIARLTQHRMREILERIIDRCLFFLNDIVTELQYGGVVEYLMEEVRKQTDEKIGKIDPKITNEIQSIYLNLTSNNPSDWSKVGHSSRNVLKALADKVFPPRDGTYKTKSGKEIAVGESNYCNRLCAFIDQETSGEEEGLLTAEIQYLSTYLQKVTAFAQKVEHDQSTEKFHANMLAIHTYLVISEIIRHISDVQVTQ